MTPGLCATLCAITSLGAPAVDGVDDAVKALIAQLDLGSQSPLASDEDLAVAARVIGTSAVADLPRLLVGLSLEEVTRATARTPLALVPQGDAPLASIDEVARREGAEWLLLMTAEQIVPNSLELRAELRAIDRGLWSRLPAAEALPIARFAARSVMVPSRLLDPPVRAPEKGRLVRIETHDAPVLALALCNLDESEEDELVVLSENHLEVFAWRGGGLARLARMGFDRLARASVPVRDAFGSLVCESGRIAFGHSGLETGHLASFDPSPARLSEVRTLPGMPLAAAGDQAIIYGSPDRGQNHLSPTLMIGVPDKPTVVDLGRSLYALVCAPAGEPQVFGLTTDYELIAYDREFRAIHGLGKSGVGLSAFAHRGTVIIARTRPTLGDEILEVGLVSGPPLVKASVPAPVWATAAGALRTKDRIDIVLAVRPREESATELYALEVPIP